MVLHTSLDGEGERGKPLSGGKEYIKSRLAKFWEKHKDFDDKNPMDIHEAEVLFHALLQDFPPSTIVQAIEELRNEAEEKARELRRQFYKQHLQKG
jgi:hypothetical protein